MACTEALREALHQKADSALRGRALTFFRPSSYIEPLATYPVQQATDGSDDLWRAQDMKRSLRLPLTYRRASLRKGKLPTLEGGLITKLCDSLE